ncbi:hypothetical protein ACIREM_01145 [Streptomyces shenzhenensis]|uniref:hypothetical protein n=1 Tax=Streptomyces shenzhenensis TaxID=943815 RepID=UPI00380A3190
MTGIFRRTLSGPWRIRTYAWDADDRHTEAVTPDRGVWRYRYDALARRAAKWRMREDGSAVDEPLVTQGRCPPRGAPRSSAASAIRVRR